MFELRKSGKVLIAAFEGWNDAGEAASAAVKSLIHDFKAPLSLELDHEEYYDYQFIRPHLELNDHDERVIRWPGVSFYDLPPELFIDRLGKEDAEPQPSSEAALGESSNDTEDFPPLAQHLEAGVVLAYGPEPSRSWRRFSEQMLDLAAELEVETIIFLGALLADSPHTRPISIFTSSENAGIREELGLLKSTYEGPIGITSVLSAMAEAQGFTTLTLWASVPHYAPASPAPTASLALIQKIRDLIGLPVDQQQLSQDSDAWLHSLDSLIAEDEDLAAYIQQLEKARDTFDSPEASGEAIAEHFERYLRGQNGRGSDS